MSKKYRSADDHPYWETVKKLPTFLDKVAYTWENWHIHILGVAFFIVLIGSVAITNYNNIPSYLTGAYVNIFHLSDDSLEKPADYLARTFLQEDLGYSPEERITMRCVTDLVLDLSGESTTAELTQSTINRLDSMIPANEFDYFLMTSDLVQWLYGRYGEPFLDLREFLTAEELERYADRLRHTQDGIPVGIDISDSPMLAEMYLSADQTVCFAWFAYVDEEEHMRPFFDYIMSTLP